MMRTARLLSRRVAAVALAVPLLAGCASAEKSSTSSPPPAAGPASTASATSSAMGSMGMGAPSVNGIKPVPTQILGTATWQGMKIQARAMTAVPFVVFDGTSEHVVKPGPRTSFHLMVMLDDARTGVPIPYATVWATIARAGRVVYDERQWPMLSEYMGPHYGNNVAVPGAGEYRLSLLVSPPVAARHVEYRDVWLTPHRVSMQFHWNPRR